MTWGEQGVEQSRVRSPDGEFGMCARVNPNNGRHHPKLHPVEFIHRSASTELSITRCGECAQTYGVWKHEASDWSSSGDYYDITILWTPLAEDHIEVFRRGGPDALTASVTFRYESGWRS